MTDLSRIAERVDAEAAIAARPGQGLRLEALAEQIRTLDSPVPPAIAVPERRVYCGDNERDEYFACGWNACLAEIKRLNPERTNG